MPISLDYLYHLLSNEAFSLKLEGSIAISIVEDHLVDLYRDASQLLHYLFLLLPLSQARREQLWVILNH